jgi:D-serine dehydratase
VASVADSHRRVDGHHQEALSATALAGVGLGIATGAADRAAVVAAALEKTRADVGIAVGRPSRPCGEVR